MKSLIPVERIENKILLIRGQKVMLDRDLAELYGVETKQLSRQVSRNIDRFPDDFMFNLTREELDDLRCQFGTSRWGGSRYLPRVFTEQGVAMLSSVLRSQRAVQVNIMIMRAFVKMRELLATHKDLTRKLNDLEKKYDKQFAIVFDAIRQLMAPPDPPKKKDKMGFR
ncbi:ORF6N domain-containing protein [bacterium]|nr:ORF6N domain-containing protein [bacterium]MBU1638648.1 ORF6N domain-containing protein [bacterium]MBU1920938.1 ORF6N domain-containing protein [bacterium]